MAQFTFADEDDPQPPPAAPPPQPPAATPQAATPPAAPAAFSFADADEEVPAPEPPAPKPPAPVPQAPTPQAQANTAPAAPRPPAVPTGPAPRAPQPPAAPQVLAPPQAPRAPQPQAPVSPANMAQAQGAPQVLGRAVSQAAAQGSDNPVRDAARAAAQAPDHGASAGMVGGAIPNVAGQRAPSPPLPNQVSNPAQSPQAPVPPTPPVPPQAARPTTARQAAAAAAQAQRAAAAPPVPPTVHAAAPGMAASTITPDVPMAPARDWRSEISRFDPQLGWLFRVAVIATVLSLGYIVLGLMGGAGSREALQDPATRARALQFSSDILLASRVLHWALLITAITTILIALDTPLVGPIIAGVGFLLHFGVPIALARMGTTPATLNVSSMMRTTGMVLLILGLAKYSTDFLAWLKELPNRARARADIGSAHKAEAKQQQTARYANMFSPCWQLPFCREVIRKQCPAFLARTRCWKFGRGCYCDEEMIGRIIRGESLDRIKAPTQMSSRKPPCGRCHIFIEHQALKYKVMAPLAVPATIGIMYASWSTVEKLFLGLNDRMNALWGTLSFSRPNIMDVPDEITKAADLAARESAERTAQYGLWIFGILMGFFLLIYISKFIEWAVLDRKL